MTQPKTQETKMDELNAVFLTLDEVTQEYALTLLQTLRFAQSKCYNARREDVKSQK